MARAERERGHSGINRVNTSLHRFDNAHRSKSRGIVCVKLNRYLDSALKILYKAFRFVRCEQRGHILYADGVRAGVLDLLCVIHVILMSKYFAEGIGDCHLSVSVLLIRRFDCGLQIADIVKRVENTDYIDTVGDGFLNKILNQIVRVMTVAQHILSSEQHLEFGVGHLLAQYAQALPRVLVQKAYAGVKGSSSPAFRGIKADLVHGGQYRTHIVH